MSIKTSQIRVRVTQEDRERIEAYILEAKRVNDRDINISDVVRGALNKCLSPKGEKVISVTSDTYLKIEELSTLTKRSMSCIVNDLVVSVEALQEGRKPFFLSLLRLIKANKDKSK